MTKRTLNDIGRDAGTDKSDLLHDYLKEYEKLFPKPDAVKKVVELGVQRRDGKWYNAKLPSISMWLEFFPNAHVYGFDYKSYKSESDRVTLFHGDQGRMKHHMEFGELTGWDIDFVLDDASHRSTAMMLSFLFFYPRLKSGGVYVFEDIQAKVNQEYPEYLRSEFYIPDYLDRMNFKWCWVPSKSAGEKSSIVIHKP